jgi:hypothetical protein
MITAAVAACAPPPRLLSLCAWLLLLLHAGSATASSKQKLETDMKHTGNCVLLKLPKDAKSTTDEERGCYDDWAPDAAGKNQRLLRYGVPGCGLEAPDTPPPKLEGTCNPATITPQMCGAMCYSLGLATDEDKRTVLARGKYSGKPFRLAGVEDGRQCFCDDERNPDYPKGNLRHPLTVRDNHNNRRRPASSHCARGPKHAPIWLCMHACGVFRVPSQAPG